MAIAYGDAQLFNLGLLLIRLIFGLAMVAHGSQKLFGWFGGYGLAGTGGFLESLGFRPGHRFAAAAALSEFVGGWLLALGLFGPVGPALILAVMLVASISVHLRNGFFATANGVELPLLIATAVVGIALIGFGNYSLDAALGLTQICTSSKCYTWTPGLIGLALAVGVIGGIANLLLRKKPTTPDI